MQINLDKWIKNDCKLIKNIFYLNWYNQDNPIAIFSNKIPGKYNFNKKIKWKINNKKIDLNIYGLIPNGEKIDNYKGINYNIPFLKSHLQKCVRRNYIKQGINTAYSLFHLSYNEFIRRLPIIIIEDSILIEKYPVIIWLMIVYPEYKIEYSYQLNWIILLYYWPRARKKIIFHYYFLYYFFLIIWRASGKK